MKIIEVKGYFCESENYEKIKEILDKTILKDRYNMAGVFMTNQSFEFAEFENQKDYFVNIIKEIIKAINPKLFIMVIKYENKGIIFKQILEHNEKYLFLSDHPVDHGYFCPHCFAEANYKKILKNINCPHCDKKISECLEIIHESDLTGINNIYFQCHDDIKIPILRWFSEEISQNPHRILHCEHCGKEYELKDIINGILPQYVMLDDYRTPPHYSQIEVLKMKSSRIAPEHHKKLKEILDDTLLKNNYEITEGFESKSPFLFVVRDDMIVEDHFSLALEKMIKAFNTKNIQLEMIYKKSGKLAVRKYRSDSECFIIIDGLADNGYFCPHCLEEADYKQIFAEKICPHCNGPISDCLNIKHIDIELPEYTYTDILVSCSKTSESLFPILYSEIFEKEPEKLIHCSHCEKDYRLKNIQKSVYNNCEIIREYGEDTK